MFSVADGSVGDDGAMRRAVDVQVTGLVQGVAFRAYAEREATSRGLAGWVRNEPDGSVAAHFEGDADAVDAMVAWCGHGPPLARVERLDVQETPESGLRSFRVRF